ncbi:SMP-30/gluconolactonase/LRE family protein [Dinghuibacter silviterrae]|nr:SMP-30/gluconolactonase/LRE family protein [Dinghuibacter silviterrae]
MHRVVWLLLFPVCVRAQEPLMDSAGLVVPGATPRLVARTFDFTEGASVDKHGNVFFTDQPNNRIWEYDTHGRLSLFMDSAGRSNGMYFDAHGNLVSCADEIDELWSISPHKKVRVLVHDLDGHRLNGPNDLWIDTRGGIYFTDPYYQRPYWNRSQPDLPQQCTYYLAPGAHHPFVVDSSLVKPNGIVGTPDGKHLYIADIQDGKTYIFTIQPDGHLTDRRLFVSMGSDGITLDERGDLYLTGRGVTVFSPEGKRIAHIPIPEGWTANLCFGGADKRTLFITASKGIYVLPMTVSGVE